MLLSVQLYALAVVLPSEDEKKKIGVVSYTAIVELFLADVPSRTNSKLNIRDWSTKQIEWNKYDEEFRETGLESSEDTKCLASSEII